MGNIRRAWCVELEEAVTAHDAKREFFAMDPRPEKLTFLCADERCRDATPGGTRVTCVNYKKLPSEEAQSVVVHYRELDRHQPWCAAYEADDEDETTSTASKEAKGSRASKTKRNDSFQVFDPGAASETVKRPPGTGTGPIDGGPGRGRGTSVGPSATTPEDGTSSTRFVEDLAALHAQARKDPAVRALLQEEITVRDVGTRKLADLFVQLEQGRIGGRDFIWYGGARLKPYGNGFSLTFFGTVDGLTVSTYVSPEQMKGYRYRASLEETIRLSENCRYVKAYVWGSIVPSEREGQASLIPERLQHLAIILGPEREAG